MRGFYSVYPYETAHRERRSRYGVALSQSSVFLFNFIFNLYLWTLSKIASLYYGFLYQNRF